MRDNLDDLIERAIAGDREALQEVILEVKDLVFNLSQKMLLFTEDAEDATQDILIRVITRLSTFKGESEFTTWVYRVATNFLLTAKGKKSSHFAMDFSAYEQLIDEGHSDKVNIATNEGELKLLEEEVKVSCTHGLLLCLNARSRMVFILGDILELTSKEGAAVMEMTAENFRQLLARSRAKIRSFLQHKCGLVDPQNPCRCRKKVDHLADKGLIMPGNPRFARQTKHSLELIRQIDELERAASMYRTTPMLEAPESVMDNLKALINQVN